MRRSVLLRSCAAILFCGAGWLAYTQNQKAPPPLKIDKVKEDLYVILGDGGNSTVYVTNEGVILVDDKFDRDHDEIMAKVKSVTDKPIKYVLNTHHHGDHTGGNPKIMQAMPGVQVLAHTNARANMVKGNLPGLPEIVFNQESSVFLGGKEARLLYFGRGHTNGDVVVYFPALRVLSTGDLITAGDDFPQLIDYSGGGSAIEWEPTVDGMLKLDFDTVIPGHGAVGNRQTIMTFKTTAANLRNRVRDMVKQGKSKDEVAKMLTSDFHWQQLQLMRGLDGIMQEMR